MGRLAGTVARACLTVGIALMAAALARAEPAAAADLTVEQIEKIVRDYLLREPKVVFDALQELQRQEAEATAARQKAAIAANQKKLLDDPLDPGRGQSGWRRHPGRVLRLSLHLLPSRRVVRARIAG